MQNVVTTESLRGNRTWLIVADAADGLRVLGCYEVAPRRAEYLAACIMLGAAKTSWSGQRIVVTVEDAPRYEPLTE